MTARKTSVVLIDPYKDKEELGYKSGRLKGSDQLMYSLGLGFIAHKLEKDGHTVTVLDLKYPELRANYIDTIKSINPDIIGITVAITTFKEAHEITRELKKRFQSAMVLWGGAFPSLYWQECFDEYPEIDAIVVGEGENTMAELCEAVGSSGGLSAIEGLAFRENGQVRKNPPRPYIENLDELDIAFDKLPIVDQLPDPIEYRREPTAQLITSRGCPFSCSFCHKPVHGSKYRFESPEKTFANMKYLIDNYGIKSFFFVDDSFTLKKDRVYALCELIKKNKLDIEWNVKTRVDLINYDLLKAMKEAGLWMMGFGIESSSQESLNLLKKGTKVEQIEAAFKYCRELKIKTRASFMYNIPGETYGMMRDTLEFAKRMNPTSAAFNITTPLPHTKLWNICKERGTLTERGFFEGMDYTTFGDPIYLNEHVGSKEELQKFVKKAYKEFYLRPGWMLGRIREIDSIYDITRYLKLAWSYRHMLKL